MEQRILKAFEASEHYRPQEQYTATIVRGQWGVNSLYAGARWDVTDENPGIDGFGFEKVCEGEER